MLYSGSCYLDGNSVPCDKDSLFQESGVVRFFRNPVVIVILILLILLILLAILAYVCVKRYKKKKELELLGYPASTISRTTPSSGARFASPRQFQKETVFEKYPSETVVEKRERIIKY